MSLQESWLPIISLVVSGIAILIAFNANRRQFDSAAMLQCLRLLSTQSVKESKELLTNEWYEQKHRDETKRVTFYDDKKLEKRAENLALTYNHAALLYRLGLLNKRHFRRVYGGNVVNTWKILEGFIQQRRDDSRKKDKSKLYEHFEEVATSFMKRKFLTKPITPD